MVPIFTGNVLPVGRIVLDRPRDLARYLHSLAGKPVELIVRRRRTQRSLPQNAYYWAVVVAAIADYTGYTPEEAHEALKAKFLTDHTGPLPKVRSTTDLTTVEFEDYVTRVRQWAATDLDVDVPEPNEVDSRAILEG